MTKTKRFAMFAAITAGTIAALLGCWLVGVLL